MTIKAVLFDMDGVLIDAREWHYEALNRALHLFGFEIDRHTHIFQYDGLSTQQKLRLLMSDKGLPAGLVDIIKKLKQKYTEEYIYLKCEPRFDHEIMMHHLRSRGLRLAVCSNSVRNTVMGMMSRSALAPFMSIMLSNEDVSRPKPDPQIYLTAMTLLDLLPEECLIIEDGEHGLQAALASGAHVLQVANPDEVSWPTLRAALHLAEDASHGPGLLVAHSLLTDMAE